MEMLQCEKTLFAKKRLCRKINLVIKIAKFLQNSLLFLEIYSTFQIIFTLNILERICSDQEFKNQSFLKWQKNSVGKL